MTHTFIALAALAAMAIPPAWANQTVEADNGAVFEILYTARSPTDGSVQAHVLTPDNEEIFFIFDCHGRMVLPNSSSNIRAIPPRSVAAGIAKIACAKI